MSGSHLPRRHQWSRSPPAHAGDVKHGVDPWLRKIPWRRAWQPTPVSLPGEFPRTEEPGRPQSMGSQSQARLKCPARTPLHLTAVLIFPVSSGGVSPAWRRKASLEFGALSVPLALGAEAVCVPIPVGTTRGHPQAPPGPSLMPCSPCPRPPRGPDRG